MLAFLNQVRKPTLDLPLDVRRKMWFKPFMQSYLVVFIGYLTMYLIRKNFNIAQNDMISTYGLSMTQLGMIGLGFSITYGVGKTVVSYYADGKNTKQFLPFMLILSAICMLGFSASMGAGSVSLFLMIAFYALSGFFQSTGGSCSYSTITKWTPRAGGLRRAGADYRHPWRLPARQQPVHLPGVPVRARLPGVWSAITDRCGGSGLRPEKSDRRRRWD